MGFRGFAARVGFFEKNWARGGAVKTAPFQNDEELMQLQMQEQMQEQMQTQMQEQMQEQPQVPIRLRSGQAFDSLRCATVAQDDSQLGLSVGRGFATRVDFFEKNWAGGGAVQATPATKTYPFTPRTKARPRGPHVAGGPGETAPFQSDGKLMQMQTQMQEQMQEQPQVPIRLRSGQAFDSLRCATVAQDDSQMGSGMG